VSRLSGRVPTAGSAPALLLLSLSSISELGFSACFSYISLSIFPNSGGFKREETRSGEASQPGRRDGERAALGLWQRWRRSGQVGVGLGAPMAGARRGRRRLFGAHEDIREGRRKEVAASSKASLELLRDPTSRRLWGGGGGRD